jgi:hypothetical protein
LFTATKPLNSLVKPFVSRMNSPDKLTPANRIGRAGQAQGNKDAES